MFAKHRPGHLASRLTRRQVFGQVAFGLMGMGAGSIFLPELAAQLGSHPARRRHCILLWMPGGPSQLDTFDMKPGHGNGGPFAESATSVPGMRFSEHLPQLARWGEQLAILRGLQTREGDHDRGTYLVRTGQRPGGPLHYPAIGASLAKQLGDERAELPQYVQVAPSSFLSPSAFSSGFLGPQYAPATVSAEVSLPSGDAPTGEGVEDAGQPLRFTRLGLEFLRPPGNLEGARSKARAELWSELQSDFRRTRPDANVEIQDTVYRRAMRLMQSRMATAFELDEEPEPLRRRYGTGTFGQGCLLARRLVERGVPFVEVSLNGNQGLAWDTHVDNFPAVQALSAELDAGWCTLLEDLQDRGLLASTTILWMGEFGRTPTINSQGGRDHYPQAWTCVFAGGGIQGGAIHGQTSDDGREVIADPVSIGDVLATLCTALGVDPTTENFTEQGRPIRLAEGSPIRPILAS